MTGQGLLPGGEQPPTSPTAPQPDFVAEPHAPTPEPAEPASTASEEDVAAAPDVQEPVQPTEELAAGAEIFGIAPEVPPAPPAVATPQTDIAALEPEREIAAEPAQVFSLTPEVPSQEVALATPAEPTRPAPTAPELIEQAPQQAALPVVDPFTIAPEVPSPPVMVATPMPDREPAPTPRLPPPDTELAVVDPFTLVPEVRRPTQTDESDITLAMPEAAPAGPPSVAALPLRDPFEIMPEVPRRQWGLPTELADVAPSVSPEPEITLAPVTPPTIEAIEVDDGGSYVAGAGEEGATIRLFIDGRPAGETVVEAGRWLIETDDALNQPSQRLRVDMLRPGSTDIAATDQVDFVIDIPAAPTRPPVPSRGETPPTPPAQAARPEPPALPPEIAPDAAPPAPPLPDVPEPATVTAERGRPAIVPDGVTPPPVPSETALGSLELPDLPDRNQLPFFPPAPAAPEAPLMTAAPPAPAELDLPDLPPAGQLPYFPPVEPEPQPAPPAIAAPETEPPPSAPTQAPGDEQDRVAVVSEPLPGMPTGRQSPPQTPAPLQPAEVIELVVPEQRVATAPTPPAIEEEPAAETSPVRTIQAIPMGDAVSLRFSSGKAIIRRGDTLWDIADRVYGDGYKYRTIYRANRHLIRRPSRIYPGQVFDIPLVYDER